MSTAKLMSESFVRPKIELDESKRIHHLNPFDLRLLYADYPELGFLFSKPSSFSLLSYLEKLRFSLSQALVHFYPLAGQLVTVPNHSDNSCYIYVDCTMGPGARLIHASALDLTVLQVSRPNLDVVRSFFDLGQIRKNHDGHTRPLLSVQLTELSDGVFLGICFNHSVVDGTSAFHFQRVWSHIFMGTLSSLIPLPVIKKPSFFYGRIFKLPYVDPKEYIIRDTFGEGELSKRCFNFSTRFLKNLKAIANSEARGRASKTITTFEALTALTWKCITRARKLPPDEVTTIALSINLRPRFNPSLTDSYFGNYSSKARGSAKVGDLLNNSVGWAATLLQQVVAAQDDTLARAIVKRALVKGPEIEPPTQTLCSNNVNVGGSTRFDVNESLFGLGKLVAFREGYGYKMDGKVNAFSGPEGDGSVDLIICLRPQAMSALLSDQQFMSFTSLHNAHFNLISKV
ncbi:hypothetical protein vseg_002744 [Gypsophila vaccaria]